MNDEAFHYTNQPSAETLSPKLFRQEIEAFLRLADVFGAVVNIQPRSMSLRFRKLNLTLRLESAMHLFLQVDLQFSPTRVKSSKIQRSEILATLDHFQQKFLSRSQPNEL